jgi:FKBP-type peptidyl-prolyl cis-trans isomerase
MTRTNGRILILGIFSLVLVLLVACDLSKKFEKEEKKQIQNFITNNTNLDYQLKPSGLYYVETLAGTGPMPVVNDSVYVHFTGSFLTGYSFASTLEDITPFAFKVGEGPILGLDEGVQYMKVGGKALLLIPSKLAYGAQGNYYLGIGAFTPLLFTVELISAFSQGEK